MKHWLGSFLMITAVWQMSVVAQPIFEDSILVNDGHLSKNQSPALDGAGNLMVIGLPGNRGGYFGSAYLLDRTTNQQIASLVPPELELDTLFGFAVATDGNVVLVSAPLEIRPNDGGYGVVHVFDAVTAEHLGTLTPSTNGSFGWDMAIAGTKVVVAGHWFVEVFDLATLEYSYTILPPTPEAYKFADRFSVYENTVLVLAHGEDVDQGEGVAYAFDVNTGALISRYEISYGSMKRGSGAMSDRHVVFTFSSGGGCPGDEKEGFSTVFLLDAQTGELLHRFYHSDVGASPGFGGSLALANGYVIIGDPGNTSCDEFDKAVLVFDAETYELVAELKGSGSTRLFGIELYAEDSTLAVGAYKGTVDGVETLFPTYLFDLTTLCPADLNNDTFLDIDDITTFVTRFLDQDPRLDFNTDGILDIGDIIAFVNAFLAGC